MIRSLLYLETRPGHREDLIQWYRDLDVLERSVELAGCRTTEVYRLPEPDRVLVTALWDSAEDYQTWVDHPFRQSLSEGISGFLKEEFAPGARGMILESAHAASLP